MSRRRPTSRGSTSTTIRPTRASSPTTSATWTATACRTGWRPTDPWSSTGGPRSSRRRSRTPSSIRASTGWTATATATASPTAGTTSTTMATPTSRRPSAPTCGFSRSTPACPTGTRPPAPSTRRPPTSPSRPSTPGRRSRCRHHRCPGRSTGAPRYPAASSRARIRSPAVAIDLERAEVAPGLYRLGHPLVNWYLLSTDEGVTIFDAGAPAHWPQVEEALTALGKGFGDVRALVLTHPDMDHIGFAETLRAQHGVRVLIHDEDSPQARGEAKKQGERSLLAYLWRPAALSTVAYFARSGRPKPVGEVETFADADTLDVPGRP